jgi:hypothetical protein
MKAILVTGSRNWVQHSVITTMLSEAQPDLVIHGGHKRGADAIADAWCDMADPTACLRWPAQWDGHGLKAGPMRNGYMLRLLASLKADGWEVYVLAFPLPDSKGTFDCIRQAKALGLQVREFKG